MKDLSEEQLLIKRDSLVTEMNTILERIGYVKSFLDRDVFYRIDIQLAIRSNFLKSLLAAKRLGKELEDLQTIHFEKPENLPCLEDQVKIIADKKQLMDFVETAIDDVTNELKGKTPEQFANWLVTQLEEEGCREINNLSLEAMFGKEVKDLVMQKVRVI